ncbi:GAF and ANTAR domain-containing protein [Streptomyces iconiensis]|uniref:GAF and ANTAR domain-containing protein n=1 Tax=Streptomyces iconiensis TaxID=1384038 RepID=A0ABT7A0M6_9ACTN|nr:GAF and ANTAR domain-containing protein [Streptomyces iconiensis]MDJ1134887.1 GAF and ANTAR domain-containing protein [Streptomyces iconiensis]
MQEGTESHGVPGAVPVEALLDLVDAVGRERDTEGRLRALCDLAHRHLAAAGHRAETGVLLPGGDTEALRACHEGPAARKLQGFELRRGHGPAREVMARGHTLADIHLERPGKRWPGYTRLALGLGVHRVTAVPLGYGEHPRGALVVYSRQQHALGPHDLGLLQALAHATALGLAHHHQLGSAREQADRLQGALTSRIPIEQAKGALSERLDCTPDEAFTLLRLYARSHQKRLHEVCTDVLDGKLNEPPFQPSSPPSSSSPSLPSAEG